MKRLLFAVALLCAYAYPQTINPNQIRPGTADGQVLTTVTANQPPSWQALNVGCTTADCVITDPTKSQVITQPASTRFTYQDSATDGCSFAAFTGSGSPEYTCLMGDGSGIFNYLHPYSEIDQLNNALDFSLMLPGGLNEQQQLNIETNGMSWYDDAGNSLIQSGTSNLAGILSLQAIGPQQSGVISTIGNLEFQADNNCVLKYGESTHTDTWNGNYVTCLYNTSSETITLPAASGPAARNNGIVERTYIKGASGTNPITLQAAVGDNINGASTYTLTTQYQSVTLMNDSTHDWFIIAQAPVNTMVYPAAGVPVSTGTAWGTSLAAPSGALVGATDTQTLTNKTVDGVSPITFGYVDPTSSIQTQLNARPTSPVPNSALQNSATTVNGQTCALGGSCTITAAPTGAAGGDLSGSYPNPVVSQINGGAVPINVGVLGTDANGKPIKQSTNIPEIVAMFGTTTLSGSTLAYMIEAFFPIRAIYIDALDVSLGAQPVGCTTWPTIVVSINGTPTVMQVVTNGTTWQFQSTTGAPLAVAAGSRIQISTQSSGCSNTGSGAADIQYHMQ